MLHSVFARFPDWLQLDSIYELSKLNMLSKHAQARIYAPARTASQSGLARTVDFATTTPAWKIEFEPTAK